MVFVGVFDKEFVVVIKSFEIKFGDVWVYEWFVGCNLKFFDYGVVV